MTEEDDFTEPPNGTLPKKQQLSPVLDCSHVESIERTQGELKPGRLSIICIQAANLRRKDRKDDKTLLKNYVKLTLGYGSKYTVEQKSKIYHCANKNPSFQNERLSFDIQEPTTMMCRESDHNDKIKLKIEIFDQDSLKSFMVGEATIAVNKFLNGELFTEWVPLLQKDDKTSNTSINLQFKYELVREGMLMLTLMESKNLRIPSTEIIPFHTRLVFSVGQNVKEESNAIEDESGNPSYSQENIFLDISKENWFHAMNIQICNLSTESNEVFGEHSLDFLPWMTTEIHASQMKDHLELPLRRIGESKIISGMICLKVKFLPSTSMHIKLAEAKSLREFETSLQTMNPYVLLRSKGRASCPQYRSETISGGGRIPVWNEECSFSVVDHSVLSVECFDHDFVTNTHQLIGSGQISLIPAYRSGFMSKWVTLTRVNEYGGSLPCGEVKIEIVFQDVDLAFPYLHESSQTVKFKSNEIGSHDSSKQLLVQKTVNHHTTATGKHDFHHEFSDEEIRSTFDFLDLDKNGYIGASELRHVLINMGELITDEEVDTMISMLDLNGDGQVNFQQFEAMARNPNLKQSESKSNKQNGLKSHNTFQVENFRYDTKQQSTLFLNFIVNNKIEKSDVMDLRDFFLQRHRLFVSKQNQDSDSYDYFLVVCAITFEQFCEILPIEPTGESQEIFTLFDHQKGSVIDLRELILSFCNFIESFSVEEKCSMVFELFEDGRGFITSDDLKIILAATHLRPFTELSRKVQTVLSFVVDKKGTNNKISQDLFREAAMKFPNLLLPKKVSTQ